MGIVVEDLLLFCYEAYLMHAVAYNMLKRVKKSFIWKRRHFVKVPDSRLNLIIAPVSHTEIPVRRDIKFSLVTLY